MKYSIVYSVSITEPSEQLSRNSGSVISKIFDFPNLIHEGDKIFLSPSWYAEIKDIQHIFNEQERYTNLFVSEEVSNQNDLEGKLGFAKQTFAKLK